MTSQIIFKLNDTDLQLSDSDVIEDNFTFLNSSLLFKKFPDPAPYYGEYFSVYYIGYRSLHGYLSFIICVFGIIANILNITVLTRKNMVSSTNALLTGLAVSDMLLMLSYLPYVYHNYIRNITEKERFSYGWVIFNLFSNHFTVVNHTISTWLTVIIAAWRYIAVSCPLKSASLCSMARAKYTITATYATCAVLYIPNYIIFTVSDFKSTDGEIIYGVKVRSILSLHYRLLENISCSLFGILIKFVPCVILTALSLGLIRAMTEARKRRKIMGNIEENDRSHDRTTKMLLAVVWIFLLTQFPQGLVLLLRVFLGEEFYYHVYFKLGETMDALSLINSSINFIIFCSMGRKFRDTFSLVFLSKCKHRQESVARAEPLETSNGMGKSCKKERDSLRKLIKS